MLLADDTPLVEAEGQAQSGITDIPLESVDLAGPPPEAAPASPPATASDAFAAGADDEGGSPSSALTGLAGGLTSKVWGLGGSMAEKGLDLGSKAGSVGLDLGSKVGSAGFGLGNMMGSGLGSATGLLGKALMGGGGSQDAEDLPDLSFSGSPAAAAEPGESPQAAGTPPAVVSGDVAEKPPEAASSPAALEVLPAPSAPEVAPSPIVEDAPAAAAPDAAASPAADVPGALPVVSMPAEASPLPTLVARAPAQLRSVEADASPLPTLGMAASDVVAQSGGADASPPPTADPSSPVGLQGGGAAAAEAGRDDQGQSAPAPSAASAEPAGGSAGGGAPGVAPSGDGSQDSRGWLAVGSMGSPTAGGYPTAAAVETAGHAGARPAADEEELRSLRAKCSALEADLQARSQRDGEREARLSQLEGELRAAQQAAQRAASEAEARAGAAEAKLLAEQEQMRGQLAALQASLDAAQARAQQDATAAAGQLEQLRFALGDKDRQLQEKADLLSKKDAEVKSLLRQLSTVSHATEPTPAASSSPAEEQAATTFEVMFALEGALGLEFQRLAAPYIVLQVHANGVAVGLDISPGDELIKVADFDVTELPWEELKQHLQKRPVVARFRRDPRRREEIDREEVGGLFEIAGNVGMAGVTKGASLLTAAISAVPGVPGGGRGGAGPGTGEAPADHQRLLAEVERLGTLLRARDDEVADLGNQVRQRDEALRVVQAGDAGLADAARLAQEAAASSQQLQQLQAAELRAERDAATKRCAEETAEKEEYRQQVGALTERCNSLMAQFETLRGTFLNPQQKAAMEAQMQELMRMNAQWQQAHQNLNADAESLRQHAVEKNQLQQEVESLREMEHAFGILQARLHEAESQLGVATEETQQLREARISDQDTIQRLQAVVESVQESGDSQAGFLEAELMERSREAQKARRDADEMRARVEELLSSQRESREAAEEGRSLREANETLAAELEASKREREQLDGVLQRCLAKLEREGMERPHLVDKRMVTQMLAAFLEQRDNPRQAQEIIFRMADLLGFTAQEREQAGLSQRRRTLLEQQEEPASLEELSDRFVDFLLEESEGA